MDTDFNFPPIGEFTQQGTLSTGKINFNPPPLFSFNKPKPPKPRNLTSAECVKLFGAREAVLMNFIPQMLTAIAMEQAEAFIKYCSDNRLQQYKSYNREIRKCINEYNYELRMSYGPAWQTYQSYLARLRNAVGLDLFRCWCTFTNEAARQFIGIPHKDVPARVTFIRMLFTFIEEFDRQMDKVIEHRTKQPCRRKRNPYCLLISLLCVDIAETFGYQMEITDNMSLCVKVLANRCSFLVDDIMADEDTAERIKS